MSTSRFRLTKTPVPRTPLSTTQFYTPFSTNAASPTTPTPSQSTAHPRTPRNPKRPYREEDGDENCVPNAADRPLNLPKKRRYMPRRNDQEKLRDALKEIDRTGWTFGEFLYHVFRMKDRPGNPIHRDKSHSQYVSHFLQGESEYTPAIILEAWYKHPDGRISEASMSKKLMYSTGRSLAYTEIKNVPAMLTSFAVQVVEEKLIGEAKAAVLPSNGLHASSIKKSSHQVQWADIGAATTERVAEIIQKSRLNGKQCKHTEVLITVRVAFAWVCLYHT